MLRTPAPLIGALERKNMLSASERAAVENRLAAFLADPGVKLNLVPLARQYNALPVYSDIGGDLFLTLSGEILHLNEGDPKGLPTLETDPVWQLIAAVVASEKYPELAFLRPQRPLSAKDCLKCEGTGHPMSLGFICGECFGLGWLDTR